MLIEGLYLKKSLSDGKEVRDDTKVTKISNKSRARIDSFMDFCYFCRLWRSSMI